MAPMTAVRKTPAPKLSLPSTLDFLQPTSHALGVNAAGLVVVHTCRETPLGPTKGWHSVTPGEWQRPALAASLP
jgi:hypothetical protein